MRRARRSLVVVIVLATSVIATPAFAADDPPGLLDTLGKTVDSLTAPILPKTNAEPVSTSVETLSHTVAGVTNNVVDPLRSTPLAPVVEPVLALVTPKVAPPEQVVPEVVAPDVVSPEQDRGELIGSLDLLGGARVSSGDRPFATRVNTLALPGSFATESDDDVVGAVAQTAHIPGTSTLPDGGTSLTTTWLMLWAGVVAAGALIVRRSRTS